MAHMTACSLSASITATIPFFPVLGLASDRGTAHSCSETRLNNHVWRENPAHGGLAKRFQQAYLWPPAGVGNGVMELSHGGTVTSCLCCLGPLCGVPIR